MPTILASLRLHAPKLTRHFFQCAHQQRLAAVRRVDPIPWRGRISRHPSLQTRRWESIALQGGATAPPSALAQSLSRSKSSAFPQTSQKAVAYWLLGSAASVFGIVVFGGLTRLTESGLSITEWRPVTGSLPPRNMEEWQSEFDKYRSSPEFQKLNPNMTMQEFKFIYYMEWTHRLWGRFVGISFVVPAVYFIARRQVSGPMALRIMGIGGLIGFQGFLGWWMVKSGLKDDLFAPEKVPRVSQYRLVAHLGTAFACYSAMLWNGLAILRSHTLFADLKMTDTTLRKLGDSRLQPFRRQVGALAVLVFITAMSGGLVAGLDAGLIYNEFPYMGVGLTPPMTELFSDFYSHKDDRSDLWWRNPLENPSLVQLDHRILAMTTFTSIIALFAYARHLAKNKNLLPRHSYRAMHGVVGFACLQVALGLTTLLYLVPTTIASAHQAGSLALLSYVLVLGSRTWLPNQRVMRQLTHKIQQAGSDRGAQKVAARAIRTAHTLSRVRNP